MAGGRGQPEWVPMEERLGAQQGGRGDKKALGLLTIRLNLET